MKFNRLVLKWPSVVLELLIGPFTESTHVAIRLMFEMNFTTNILLRFTLNYLGFLFNPIQNNLLQQTVSILNK
jgi:hypothetical protein